MTRRAFISPRRVPRPPEPAAFEPPEDPLARVAVGGAWRAQAYAASLGRGLRRAPAGATTARVAARIHAATRLSAAFLDAVPDGDRQALGALVEARLAAEPTPWVESWAEGCVADLLVTVVATEALAALEGSSAPGLSSLAERFPGAETAFGADELPRIALEEGDRECVQLLVDRWTPFALQCLGRPDGAGEPKALEARIKRTPAAESLRRVLPALREALEPHGLVLPDAARVGLVLPEAP